MLTKLRQTNLKVTLTGQDQILEKILQEFNLLTAREQSRLDSRCPSLFTLELERLPDLLPSVLEGMRDHLIGTPVPA